MDKASTTTVVCTIFAALVSVLLTIWVKDRRKKILAWEVKFNQALVSRTGKDEEVKILFNDQVVDEPHMVAIRFTNTGGMAIAESDFQPPLSLHFGSKVLQATWIFDPPVSVRGEQHGEEALRLEPLLLNPREYFEVMVYTDKKPTFSCTGRIKDGQILASKKRSSDSIRSTLSGWIVLFTFGTVYWLLSGCTQGAFNKGLVEYTKILVSFILAVLIPHGIRYIVVKCILMYRRRVAT